MSICSPTLGSTWPWPHCPFAGWPPVDELFMAKELGAVGGMPLVGGRRGRPEKRLEGPLEEEGVLGPGPVVARMEGVMGWVEEVEEWAAVGLDMRGSSCRRIMYDEFSVWDGLGA
jgi:hypothetical protein